jgi:type IV secretory pathway TrbL component
MQKLFSKENYYFKKKYFNNSKIYIMSEVIIWIINVGYQLATTIIEIMLLLLLNIYIYIYYEL